MKKFKFLPSVLMLVVCIAVLCVGVFSASATSNTVKGSITVTSMAKIRISGYIDGEEELKPSNTAGGVTWDLTKSEKLKFEGMDASDESDLAPKVIRIRIQNLSTMPLGAYFYSGEGLVEQDGAEYASYESLQHGQEIYPVDMAEVDKNENTKLADVVLSTYTYIAPNDNADGGFDEVDMYIQIKVANLFYEDLEGEFEFSLRVEEYKTGELGTTKKLLKLPEATDIDINQISYSVPSGFPTGLVTETDNFYTVPQVSSNIGVVSIPTSYTGINTASFENATGLEHIIIPASVEVAGAGCFANCLSLVSIDTAVVGELTEKLWYDSVGHELFSPICTLFANNKPASGADKFVKCLVYQNPEYMSASNTYITYYMPNTIKTIFVNVSKSEVNGLLKNDTGTFAWENIILGVNAQ